MRRNVTKLILVSLLACSEPHDFEISSSSLTVVDAKISSLMGRSYINIYQNSTEEKISIEGLQVVLLTDQNDIVPFAYNQGENLYRPLDPTFVAESHLQYRMTASVQNEIIYESTPEQMEPAVNFRFAIKDTTLFEPKIDAVSGLERKAKAFVAVLPPSSTRTYAKLDFKYSFADFFTGDSTTHEFLHEFVLFSNVGIAQTGDSIEIPVRSRVFSGWFFTDQSILSIFCQESNICNPDDECCGNPCCQFQETWPAVYEMVAQSMSLDAYNYWESVEKLNNNNGLVLDTYPFPLKGNVTCSNCATETIGLFRVVSEVRERIEIAL